MAQSRVGKALAAFWPKAMSPTRNAEPPKVAKPAMSGGKHERMKVIARGRSDKAGIHNVEKTGTYKRKLAKRQREITTKVAKARKSA